MINFFTFSPDFKKRLFETNLETNRWIENEMNAMAVESSLLWMQVMNVCLNSMLRHITSNSGLYFSASWGRSRSPVRPKDYQQERRVEQFGCLALLVPLPASLCVLTLSLFRLSRSLSDLIPGAKQVCGAWFKQPSGLFESTWLCAKLRALIRCLFPSRTSWSTKLTK